MKGSLLDYLAAPVVVGDPDGNVIYVNPAFETAFRRAGEVVGAPFAQLFDGGGREGVLQAVAKVCQSGEQTTFRLREGGNGYRGSVSPIQADSNAVGVILLFTEEPSSSRSLLDLLREVREPLDEVSDTLQDLSDAMSGPGGNEQWRGKLEGAMAGLELAQKWGDDAYALLTDSASPTSAGTVDAGRICRIVLGRLSSEFERRGLDCDLLLPAVLPEASGDARHLETILARLLRDRAAQAQPLDTLSLSARSDSGAAILVSIAEPARPADANLEPVFERDAIAALAGYEHRRLRSAVGSVTTLRLPLAAAPGAADSSKDPS